MEAQEHHITVTRTARFYTSGENTSGTVWLALHGYGQLAAYFIRHFDILKDDFVVAPEALSRFYSTTKHDRIGATWMTKEDRETEIKDYLQYLDTIWEKVISPLHPQRFIIFGFSQGAATAARWAAHTQVAADHLVLWGGFFPPDMRWDDYRRRQMPLKATVMVGNRDAFITDENRAEMKSVLQKLDVSAEYVEYEGGHDLRDHELAQLQKKISG